jgi:hypothetical protein
MFCKGLPNQPTCKNRAALENGLCHSCNDKPKEGEYWFVKLPVHEWVAEVKILKFYKKVVVFENYEPFKITDVEFIEKVEQV